MVEVLGLLGFAFSGIALVVGAVALYKIHRFEIEKED